MDVKAQSSLEYLMTYGWALILISTVVGILAFVVMGPTDDFQCTVSEPTKFLLKGVDVPASGYRENTGIWTTTNNDSEHNIMIIQNITGGTITIDSVESYIDSPCTNPNHTWADAVDVMDTYNWCPKWIAAHYAGETDEGWIDISLGYGSFITNALDNVAIEYRMKINDVIQTRDDPWALGDTMCRDSAVVIVPAGSLIEITDFAVAPPKDCDPDSKWLPSGNEPGMFRLNYTDQFGLSDNVVITCRGLPEKP